MSARFYRKKITSAGFIIAITLQLFLPLILFTKPGSVFAVGVDTTAEAPLVTGVGSFGGVPLPSTGIGLIPFSVLKASGVAVPGIPTADVGSRTQEVISGLSEEKASFQEEVQIYNQSASFWDRVRIQFAEYTERQIDEAEHAWWAIAIRAALKFFFLNVAQQGAEYLASGLTGQKPAHYTSSFGNMLLDTADSAAGVFLDEWAQGLGFDICEPSLNIKIALGLGLEIPKVPKADCSLTDIADNWQEFAANPNFLENFAVHFDPEGNDFGVVVETNSRMDQYIAEELQAARLKREEEQGLKGKESDVSGKIVTPAEVTGWLQKHNLEMSVKNEEIITGEMIADTINVFVGTLASKVLTFYFEKGIAALKGEDKESTRQKGRDYGQGSGGSGSGGTGVGIDYDGGNGNDDDLYNPDGSGSSLFGGINNVQQIFTLDSQFGGKAYDLLQRLATCIFPDNPGSESCVINRGLFQAIEREMTVREAIASGLINGNAPFGYVGTDAQPGYTQGYPLRSLIILRSHRILPVTWEIAAEIVNKIYKNEIKDTIKQTRYTLNTIIAAYNDPASPFYGLVDDTWVLKAPAVYCVAEGYSQTLLTDQVVGESRTVSRALQCASYESCLTTDDDGNCIYGYCTEEKRIWDLGGNSCNQNFASCQSFVNTTSGNTASYLQNTLAYAGCGPDNVGCQWYCRAYNLVNDQWVCTNPGERVLQPCSSPAGCQLNATCSMAPGSTTCADAVQKIDLVVSSACNENSQWWNAASNNCSVTAACRVPAGGVACEQSGCEAYPNGVINGGFEAIGSLGSPAQAWNFATSTGESSAYFERVSGASEAISEGQYSVRFFTSGAQKKHFIYSNPIALPNTADGKFTFSVAVFNRLNIGSIAVEVVSGSNGNTATEVIARKSYNAGTFRNQWERVTIDIAPTAAQRAQVVVRLIVEPDASGLVNGSVWFDDVRLTQSCLVEPVRLTMIGDADQDGSKIHFDRDVQSCDPANAGCRQLISLAPNTGTNVVPNASFEDWALGVESPTGWKALNVQRISGQTPHGSLHAALNNGSLTVPLSAMQPGTGYFVSFWARSMDEQNTGVAAELSLQSSVTQAVTKQLTLSGNTTLNITSDWQRYVFDATTTPREGYAFALTFRDTTDRAMVAIDGVQVEAVTSQGSYTAFKEYGATNVNHLKIAPDYLDCRGYTITRPSPYVLDGVTRDQCIGVGRVWRDDSCSNGFCCHEIDAPECGDFALQCQADEVGCEAYTLLSDSRVVIPGVARADDYCPVECVGYEAYKQSPTFFESQQTLEFFIPATADSCSAAAVGCDEFTNLDEVAAGGEGKEYYQYLRHCVKPDEATCQNYYAWQGSDESGYQLLVYQLQQNADGTPREATTDEALWLDTWGSRADCDGPEDIVANPFCRELIGVNGVRYYRILANTVSCSADCHPFRKTVLGETPAIAQQNCERTNGVWNGTACTYQAIPGEGQQCNAAAVGCREYRGNTSANVFVAFEDAFNDGDSRGWSAGRIASESLTVGGMSLRSTAGRGDVQAVQTMHAGLPQACNRNTTPICRSVSDSNCFDEAAQRCVARSQTGEICHVEQGQQYCGALADRLTAGRSYLVSFWAKVNATPQASLATLSVDILALGNSSAAVPVGAVAINSEWNYYSVGPVRLDTLDDSVRLRIANTQDDIAEFFVDNIAIKEVTDYVYAIKNSWQTPASCDTNPYVTPAQAAPQFMLGCKQYTDSASRVHNLKSFTSLCREEAVGCAAFIDTHNSNSPWQQEFNTADAASNVVVPADQIIYATNRTEFQCPSSQQGCEAVGLPTVNPDRVVVAYENAYLINDPDNYGATLCNSGEVGCEEYRSQRGLHYFKDPGNKVCVYRNIPNQSVRAWFKLGSTSAAPDCPVTKTVTGQIIPSAGWTGTCPESESGCTEFIDPVSEFSKNIIFNARFVQDIENNGQLDGWNYVQAANGSYTSISQPIRLKRDTMYTLEFTKQARVSSLMLNDFEFRVSCPAIIDFTSVDGTLQVSQATAPAVSSVVTMNKASYAQDVRTNIPAERPYAGRFMVPGDFVPRNDCVVQITYNPSAGGEKALTDSIRQHLVEVSVRETGVYHAIYNTVDRTDCNGLVDVEQGCVLFNDRGSINYAIGDQDTSYLLFDADVSGVGINNSVPVSQCSGSCDSNIILKVRPDRECSQWLDCKTTYTTTDNQGREQSYCVEMAVCDQFNEDGSCASYVSQDIAQNVVASPVGRANLTASSSLALANLSGYSTPGLSIFNSLNSNVLVREGLLHYGLMTQIGQAAAIPNGSFEQLEDTSGQPYGWYDLQSIGSWDQDVFSVISDPNKAKENEGVTLRYGGGMLRLAANVQRLSTQVQARPYSVISEMTEVMPGHEYVLSVSANTQNLKPRTGVAYAIVEGKSSSSAEPFVPLDGAWLRFPAGLNWQTQSVKFIARKNRDGALIDLIRVRLTHALTPSGAYGNPSDLNALRPNSIFQPECFDLGGDGVCDIEGASYFDNIQVGPGLVIQQGNTDTDAALEQSVVAPTCRLFPTASALSCSTQVNQNVYQVGWQGYCLVTDPTNPDICLQWWPIDLIKGNLYETVPGYQDRVPLYYCVASNFQAHQTVSDTAQFKVSEGVDGSLGNKAPGCMVYGDLDGANGSLEDAGIDEEMVDNISLGNLTNAFMDLAWKGGNTSCGRGSDFEFKPISELPASDKTVRVYKTFEDSNKMNNYYVLGSRVASSGGTYCVGYLYFYDETAEESKQGQLRGLKACAHDTGDWSDRDNHYFVFRFTHIDGLSSGPVCQAFARVVSPAGVNKSWLTRVSRGSDFLLPDSQIGYGAAPSPFGSLVAPAGSQDPADWDADSGKTGFQPLRHSQNLTLEEDPIAVATGNIPEAGSVLGCYGNTIVSPSAMYAADASVREVNTCSLIGRCEKTGASCLRYPYSHRIPGALLSASCPDETESCVPIKFPDSGNLTQALFDGRNRLKRIFAQSYGIWVWSGPTSVDGVTDGAPSVGVSCQFGNGASTCSLGGNACNSDADCSRASSCSALSCVCSAPTHCERGMALGEYGEPLNGNTTSPTCNEDETIVTDPTDPTKKTCQCATPSYCQASAILSGESIALGRAVKYSGSCPAGFSRSESCTYTPSENAGTCVDDDDCGLFSNNYCVGLCPDGVNTCTNANAAQVCSPVQGYVWTPSLQTTTGLQATDWSVPKVLCEGPNNTRPDSFCRGGKRDGLPCTSNDACKCALGDSNCAPGIDDAGAFCTNRDAENPDEYDYCAVAPRVANLKVNGSENKIEIHRSAEVVLNFNAVVDGSQLPIASYNIEWGDEKISVSRGSLRDRPNPNEPYIFSHVYDYYSLVQRNQELESEADSVIDGWIRASLESGDLVGYDTSALQILRQNLSYHPLIQDMKCKIYCNGGEQPDTCNAINSAPAGAVPLVDLSTLPEVLQGIWHENYPARDAFGWTPPLRDTIAGEDWCVVKPRVQIIDNWGWCSAFLKDTVNEPAIAGEWGYFGAACLHPEKAYMPYTNYIIVGKE